MWLQLIVIHVHKFTTLTCVHHVYIVHVCICVWWMCCCSFYCIIGEKMDADTMDEKRKEHMAYEYLCHLEEAKQLVVCNIHAAVVG